MFLTCVLVNLSNLATIAGNQAAEEELNISAKRANGPRLIVPGLAVLEGKLMARWHNEPTLAEMRAEISNSRPDRYQINKHVETLQ